MQILWVLDLFAAKIPKIPWLRIPGAKAASALCYYTEYTA